MEEVGPQGRADDRAEVVGTPTTVIAILAIVAMPAMLAATAAHAGNVEPVLVGREAVLTAGAVVSTVQDAGAAWFNPAGLSAITRSSVDVSADAFVLRIYRVPGLIEARLPGQTAYLDIEHTEFLALPSAIVIARRLGEGVTGAISLFTRAQAFVRDSDDLWARASLSATGETEDGFYEYDQSLTFIQNSSIYHAGPTLSWRATPELQVGASLFGIFQNDRGSFQLWTNYRAGNEVQEKERTVRSEQTEYALRAIGGQFVIGAQAQIAARWRVGLTYRSPAIVLHHWVGAGVVVARTQVEQGQDPVAAFFLQKGDKAGDNGTLVQPSKISLGIARQLWTGHIALEGEIAPGFKNVCWAMDRRATWNIRLGARFDLDETFSVGGGVFTDRAQTRKPTGITTTEIDSYGAALGLEFGTPYEIDGDNGEKRTLVFSTTLGVRYALGLGRVGGVVIDGSSVLIAPQPVVREAEFHELDVSLASSVNF